MPELILGGDFTPDEFLRVLQRRLINPVEAFSWLDLYQQQHSNAFTVAKTAGFDVLADIGAALDQALANGETFQQFSDNIVPILQDKGWWGRAPALDPQSGLYPISQLGSPRRLEIIYDTNMRVSYAAGNWASIQRNKADRPYLMYSAVHDSRTRPQHRAWDGTALPADDPWWDTHYPPNGWNCRCSVISLSQRQYDAMSGDDAISTEAPAITYTDWTNPRSGETLAVPEGIDPGFAYNPGQAFLAALRQLFPG